MWRYIVKRLLFLIPTILGVILITFSFTLGCGAYFFGNEFNA